MEETVRQEVAMLWAGQHREAIDQCVYHVWSDAGAFSLEKGSQVSATSLSRYATREFALQGIEWRNTGRVAIALMRSLVQIDASHI